MPIAAAEYWKRFERVLEAERLEAFDLLLVYAQGCRGMYSNLLYLTGYYNFDPSLRGALLIRQDGTAHLLLDSEWDLDRAARTSWIERRAMSCSPDLPAGLVSHCREQGLTSGRIGLAGDEYMPVAHYRRLEAGLPGVEFVPATGLIANERLLKSPAEIEALRVAADITDKAILSGILALKEGISELATLAVCASTMLELHADELAFVPEVSFGEMTEIGGAPASSNTLKRGDMVMFDLGCVFDHYVVDLSCTCVYGKPSVEQQTIFDLVVRAQEAAIRAVHPGATAAEVDSAARDPIARAGYGEYFNHGLGHGQGLDHHEPPFIAGDDLTPLRPGMVFSVEPGVYLPGVGGVRIEDTVLVTEAGCEVLSASNQHAPEIQ